MLQLGVIINELSGGVLYIQDAFPMSKDFVDAIEKNNNNKNLNKIIPEWSPWVDGYIDNGVFVSKNQKGFIKQVDWDLSQNMLNTSWPRVFVEKDYSDSHLEAYNILKMIDEPYKKTLDIWSEKTGNKKLDWVTKNYTIKKYVPGGYMTSHSDRSSSDKESTFDWTALIYLNDDYTGGDLFFDKLNHRISPSAGSILFFSTDELHTAESVLSGNKYLIFFYIQSEFRFCHGMSEPFKDHVKNIKSITS